MRASIAVAFVLVACGKGDSKPAPQPTAAPAPQPPAPPPPPSLPASVADQYQLPAVPNRAALPARPAAHIFVTRGGELRIGPGPAFADAVRAADVDALDKLIPPADPSGGGDDPGGLGRGRLGGVDVDHSGAMPVVSRAVAFAGETPPASARFILVADAGAPFGLLTDVLQAIGEPTAVAVDGGGGGTAALSVAIDTRSQPTWGGGVELGEDKPWSELVLALDTAAVGAPGKPIGVTLLYSRGFGGVGLGGANHGSGFGVSSGGVHGRRVNEPDVRIGQPSTVGDLDKAIIRRYVKRNISKLTYCYEKQLLVDDQLQGTVNATFTISPTGTVVSAQATGVAPEVSSCVADVIRAIEFPRPRNGGAVQVNYPFSFRPTGG